MKNGSIDLERIFGKTRYLDDVRLLGASPADTFDRIKAHSDPGCCPEHDRVRSQKKLS